MYRQKIIHLQKCRNKTLLSVSILNILLLSNQATFAQSNPYRITPAPIEPLTPLPPKPNPLKIEITPFESPIQQNIPTLFLSKVIFVGNTVISTNKLDTLVSGYLNKRVTFAEMLKIRDLISSYYIESGYINSGATIATKDNRILMLDGATLKIRIIEGGIEDITVIGSKRLRTYIKNRVRSSKKILNINELQKQLKQLTIDPLIESISANLVPGLDTNTAKLDISVVPKKPYTVNAFADNYRNAAAGTFERGIEFNALSSFKPGDRIDLTFSNTSGSNTLQSTYTLPLNQENTTLKFSYVFGDSVTVQNPFKKLNITGKYQALSLELRHPIFRFVSEKSSSEMGISIGIKNQNSQDKLLNIPFQISRGADLNGQTRTTVISFQQDWRYQDSIQTAILKSSFNLGIDLESKTDSAFNSGQFFSYQLQSLYTHRLPWKLLFLTRLQLQVADNRLVSSEQLPLGGFGSVLGYKQDALLRDNGIFGSVGVQIPVYSSKAGGNLTASPSFNFGYAWNDTHLDAPSQVLASIGFGIRYTEPSGRFGASVGFGLPLLDIQEGKAKNIQDAGVYLRFDWRIY